MTKLITSDRKRVGAWVAEKVGRSQPWTEDGCIGLEKDGELIAGMVIDQHFEGVRGSMSGAGVGKYWLNRKFLFAIFDYPFRVLDLKVLVNMVSSENTDSLRFTKHLGFREIGRVKQGWDGKADMVLFELHRDDCKWLKLGERL